MVVIGLSLALLAAGNAVSPEPPAWVTDLKNPQFERRRAAIAQLEKSLKAGRADTVVILALLETGAEEDHVLRMELTSLYKEVPLAARPILTNALDSTSNTIRGQAAEVLGVLGPPCDEALPRLVGLLRDSDKEVRSNASFAIGKIDAGVGGTLPALVALLKSQNVDDRLAATRTLDALGAVAGDRLDDLTAALTDPDENVRYWLVNVLGNLPATRAPVLATLMQLLTGDPSAFVRERAAREFWEMAIDKEQAVVQVVPMLATALSDQSKGVRTQAAKALQAIGANAAAAKPELEQCAKIERGELGRACMSALSAIAHR